MSDYQDQKDVKLVDVREEDAENRGEGGMSENTSYSLPIIPCVLRFVLK